MLLNNLLYMIPLICEAGYIRIIHNFCQFLNNGIPFLKNICYLDYVLQ